MLTSAETVHLSSVPNKHRQSKVLLSLGGTQNTNGYFHDSPERPPLQVLGLERGGRQNHEKETLRGPSHCSLRSRHISLPELSRS